MDRPLTFSVSLHPAGGIDGVPKQTVTGHLQTHHSGTARTCRCKIPVWDGSFFFNLQFIQQLLGTLDIKDFLFSISERFSVKTFLNEIMMLVIQYWGLPVWTPIRSCRPSPGMWRILNVLTASSNLRDILATSTGCLSSFLTGSPGKTHRGWLVLEARFRDFK